MFYIVGNHDGGLDYNGSGETVSPWHIKPDLLMQISNIYSNSDICVYDNASPFQYYFDNKKAGIRYIVLAFSMRSVSTEETYTDALVFLVRALNSVPEGYHVVIFTHRAGYDRETGTFNEAGTAYVLNVLDAYKNKTQVVVDSTTYDFQNANGVPVCLIFGHIHVDANGATPSGIPWFATSTDNCGAEMQDSPLTRTIGTVTEQLFDVVTVDKTNRTVYLTRIGAGSDRSATY